MSFRVLMRTRELGTAILWVIAVVIGMPNAYAYPRPGSTELVSLSSEGRQGESKDCPSFSVCPVSWNNVPYTTSLDRQGRYVAFDSAADGLVPEDRNSAMDVFVRDRKAGSIRQVSVTAGGSQPVGPPQNVIDLAQDPRGSRHGSFSLSYDPMINATGRFVVFASVATNLVPGDSNLAADVFVSDLSNGTLKRVSVSSRGEESGRKVDAGSSRTLLPHSFFPSISANGRYISFTSYADNLVENDTNRKADVFVHDRKTKKTERVSVTSDGSQTGCTNCHVSSALSGDGRFVAFESDAPELQPITEDPAGAARPASQVFVHDREEETTELVSVNSQGEKANVSPPRPAGASSFISGYNADGASRALSHDGRFVTFVSVATNLVPNDSNRNSPVVQGGDMSGTDVYLHDRKMGRTERIDVLPWGEEPEDPFTPTHPGSQFSPSMSPDGRYVTWSMHDDKLMAPDHPAGEDYQHGAYIHDRVTGVTEWASPYGETFPEGGWRSWFLGMTDVSADGRYVSFSSEGTTHTPEADRNPDGWDIFVYDRGPAVGVGGFEGSPADPDVGDDEICVVSGICIPRPGSLSSSTDETSGSSSVAEDGADLIQARIEHRARYRDLFVVEELKQMPSLNFGAANSVSTGSPSIVYGLRFETKGRRFEVRATGSLGGTFGLFDCTTTVPACTKVANLRGGFGTTGERIVFSLPLDEIGIRNIGELSSVEAFSAVGTFSAGVSKTLDTVRLK